MKDNTINANGVEVYQHRIYELADEYIEQELDGEQEKVNESFVDMIFYIADRIEKPSNDDIELLDGIFDIYVRLCARYRVLPTLEVFGFLIGVERRTITAWSNECYRNKIYYTVDGDRIKDINTWRFNHRGEEYREVPSTVYSDTAKKWFDICKSFTINKLHNKAGTDANLIFVAKAAYGLRETSPAPVESEPRYQRLTSREELGLEAPKERPALPGMGGHDEYQTSNRNMNCNK